MTPSMKRFLFLSLLVSELLRKYDGRVPVVHLKDYFLDGELSSEQGRYVEIA